MARGKLITRLSTASLNMRELTAIFLSLFLVIDGCILMQHGWQPKSVEERTALADVIIAGTVLRVLRHQRAWDGTYPADVLVADVYKGYELFDNVTSLQEREINAEYRSHYPNVYRVERFGDRRQCWADVVGGRNYVLYLTTNPSPRDLTSMTEDGGTEVDMSKMMSKDGLKLEANYDDIAGAAIDYSEETEENILNILGWRPWTSWNGCSEDCAGGIQTRRRMCVRDVPHACEGDARQSRRCNTFECGDMKDMKQLLSLHDFPPGVRRAPSRWKAYRISHQAQSLSVSTSQIFGKAFPSQFTILLTIKPKISRRKDHGDAYALLFTDVEGNIQFGVKMGKNPSIVYSQLDGTLQELNFTEYELDRSWHSMAFSVNKHTITLIADCNKVFTMPIDRSDRTPIDAIGTASIGGGGSAELDAYFEGDIEQLVLIDDPSAAEQQCWPQYGRFPALLDIVSTAPPSSSVNGMDASIDIGLVYDNLFDPYLFMETETTTEPMDTTFPSFSHIDFTAEESENDVKATTPSTRKWTTPVKTMHTNTKSPLKTKTTSTMSKLTVGWDSEVYTNDESQGEFNSGIRHPVTPGEYGSDKIVTYESVVDQNDATIEPDTANGDQDRLGQQATISTIVSQKSDKKITTITPSSRRAPGAYSQVKVSPTTSTVSTPASSTTRKITTATTTPTPTTTLPPTTRTLPTTRATMSTTTKRTTVTTTPLIVKSTTDSNDIIGEEETDNNSERPQHDGLVPAPPSDVLSPVAPAEVQRPAIYEFGRPEDENVNWSTWSTCSRTCGTGTRYRYTVCHPGSKLSDCRSGRGIAAQHKTCNLNNDCRGVLRWSAWSACTRTCGSGFKTRVAICRDLESSENCSKVGELLIDRRSCEELSECPLYCTGGCMNGGTCMPGGVCSCPSGYEGPVCERARCNPPCQNNGRCIHVGRCVCPTGYTGAACSQPVCKGGCKNGGQCVAPDQCHCPTGYSGPDCSQPECSPPCENGGVCARAGFCRCRTAYRGMQCQIPYCRRSCLNGGKCTGPDTCTCPRGFKGAMCRQSKCPRGCPGNSQCIGLNTCSSYGRQASSSSTRRTWCPLQSYKQTHTVTYIKPAIQKYRVLCGQYRLQTCESTRIIYQVGYRQTQRTAYRCAPYG